MNARSRVVEGTTRRRGGELLVGGGWAELLCAWVQLRGRSVERRIAKNGEQDGMGDRVGFNVKR